MEVTKSYSHPKGKMGRKIRNKYRLMATNSVLKKIPEDITYHFLVTRKLLQKKQYRFKHKTSMTMALQNILIISLDIKNAFNSIKPAVINRKLKEVKCYQNITNL